MNKIYVVRYGYGLQQYERAYTDLQTAIDSVYDVVKELSKDWEGVRLVWYNDDDDYIADGIIYCDEGMISERFKVRISEMELITK